MIIIGRLTSMKGALVFLCCVTLGLTSISSCKKNDADAASGLRDNTIYYCDTVFQDNPIRMFTSDGEVTDQGALTQYLATALYPIGPNGGKFRIRPRYIFSTRSDVVFYEEKVPFTTSVQDGVIHMRQKDSNIFMMPSSWAVTEHRYQIESAFYEIANNVLDLNGSYLAAQRIDSLTLRTIESLVITGDYARDTITLPYVYFATNTGIERRYPLPLKANISPRINPGDTLLLQYCRAEFQRRKSSL